MLKAKQKAIASIDVYPAGDCLQGKLLRTIAWFVLVACLISSISACGWRLRGTSTMELSLPPVVLQFQSATGALQRDLRNALDSSGVDLVAESPDAIKLLVKNDKQSRRVLSVGSAGKVNEYDLKYELAFAIYNQNGELLVEDVITQQRDYEFDETQVLAKGEEERQLYDFMRRTAVQTLMRRLQSTVVNNAN